MTSGLTAYVGLGSNVGDRLAHLCRAVSCLESSSGIGVTKLSDVYDTDPVGPPQATFLNAVAEISTTLGALDLLGRLKDIEAEIGRRERGRWGPREVDLDLLLYGDEMIHTDSLAVPHPQMHARAFVLVPLAEIAPDATLPGCPGQVRDLAEAVGSDGVRWAHPSESLRLR